MLCPGCPRAAEGLSCGSRGPKSARLIILGMSPGLDELGQGRPFVGSAGRILARAMLEARLHPNKAYMLNAINCLPAGGVQEKLYFNGRPVMNGKAISHAQASACRGRLQEELWSLTNAHVIVALGGEALKALTGIYKETAKWQNHPLLPPFDPPTPPWVKYILPLYHPAFIRYRGVRGEMAALKVGFQKVRQMLLGSYRTLQHDQLGEPLQLGELLGKPVAFDIENPQGFIERIGFACIFPDGQVRSGSWAWTPAIQQHTRQVLAQPGLVKIAHNMAHDIRHLYEEGVEVRDPVFDTMLAHQQLQPEMEKSLDAVSGFLLDIPRWKHLSQTHPELYNRLDAHATALLYPLLVGALQDDHMLQLFQEKVMPAMRTLIRCTQRGMRLDQHKAAEWRASLATQTQAAEAAFTQLSGGVNPRSPKQLKEFFYQTRGLPVQTNRGVPTTDVGALEKLQRFLEKEVGKKRVEETCKLAYLQDLQLIKELRSYRESSKLQGTYASLMDHTVHPSYFPVGKDDSRYGTATGRLSSQEPNVQNQPPPARLMYVPSTQGMVLLEADYSQIELRVAAFRGPEPRLIDLFLRGADVHGETTRLLGCDRTRAKNVTYGSLYGAGPRKLYDTLVAAGFKTTLAEMRALQDQFFRAYPGLLRWRTRLVDFALDHGYAVNCFGRRRYFYEPAKMVPEIVNFDPQSTVADIVLDRLPAVEQVFTSFGGAPLTTVHDSFLGEVPHERWREAARALKAMLEVPYPQVHPDFYCPVDLKVGLRWGRMKKL